MELRMAGSERKPVCLHGRTHGTLEGASLPPSQSPTVSCFRTRKCEMGENELLLRVPVSLSQLTSS